MTLQRIKWNKVVINLDLDDVIELLNLYRYDELNGNGFINIFKSGYSVSAVYSEVSKQLVEREDPFGNVLVDEINDYNYVEFSLKVIDKNKYLMTFINSPKSAKSFINYFSEILNFSFSISPVDIDIIDYISLLKENENVNSLSMKKLKISSVIVNENSKANVEIISKSNALKDIESLLGNKKYVLDRLKVSAIINDYTVNFEISKSGALLTNEDHVYMFACIMEKYLLCQEKNKHNFN